MITSNNNAKVKQVVQWQTKAKERRKDHVFLAEGIRMCEEAPVKNVREVYLTEELEQKIRQNAQNGDTAFWDKLQQTGYETVSTEVFAKMADTQTPQGILTVLEQPVYDLTQLLEQPDPLFLMLENLQDPGNLGTIIRIADWFGIEHIFCSPDTADLYNPKTVQATMGAMARVCVHYLSLTDLLRTANADIPVYGTFLDGNDMYGTELSPNGLIVMGNEGKGISRDVASLINRKLYIPNYPPERNTSESLNVAVATAIVCAEFRRRDTIG